MVMNALSKIEKESSLYYIASSIPDYLEDLTLNGKKTIVLHRNTMPKRREELYGALGVEGRYPTIK